MTASIFTFEEKLCFVCTLRLVEEFIMKYTNFIETVFSVERQIILKCCFAKLDSIFLTITHDFVNADV